MSVAQQPRELTDEEQQQRAEVCQEIHNRILDGIQDVRRDVWLLAKDLYEFNEQNGWTALNYESQSHWLADPQISMKKSQFARIVRRYREYVIQRQLPIMRTEDMPDSQVVLAEIDPSKLDIVLPAVEKGTVTLQKALEDASSLGARDLRIEYGQEEEPPLPPGGSVIDGTAHDVNDGDGKLSKEQQAALKLAEQLSESAGMVDSWLEYGGERRKVRRHLRRLVELHPMFVAMRLVEACVEDQPLEGQTAPPSKEDALGAWQELVTALRLSLPTAD